MGKLAGQRGVKVTTAESCTGGLVAQMLTDEAGASQYFIGGWVVYSNAMKTRELGVPTSLIEREGAVSQAVACAMAEGALRQEAVDWSISTTGIAGPEGGSSGKPVGTVWIAIGHRSKSGISTQAECFHFPGSRTMIRDRAAKTALNRLRLELLK